MARIDSLQFIFLLMDTPGIGDHAVRSILSRSAVAGFSPGEVLRLAPERIAENFGIPITVAGDLTANLPARLDSSAESARWARRHNVAALSILDASYPDRLSARMDSPPPVLFACGNLAVLRQPLFAIATSNGASEEALAAGDRITEIALESEWALVTGHNRVAYQRPALVMRRNGGRTCYVLDRGLIHGLGEDLSRALFPAARIWGSDYDPEVDLTLSQFGLRDHGIAANNRKRDSLIFSLADVIFAAAVRPSGHMEQVCLKALAAARPVYIVGPDSEVSGTLAANGAKHMDSRDRTVLLVRGGGLL